ncbi:cdc42 effector protein 3 [Gadus morhua]|uniref:Cdc42 effector protein 3-like n=1 Tax=Gadus morhua TaxID=8049 RepID=A0A8C5BL82_GADMO|nr:cdc42 effector protein 3-like [Gadus morhua]XP_030212494.1 cdc42 effector protein 3-like [Gadus morhua]XP_059908156.1 cdc42 effector protein 3-like [Gadus macrocephalus]
MPLRTTFRKQYSGRWRLNSKHREVLSVNMISLPLADFRHVSHIGNNAHTDSFGDLSFLKKGHSLLLKSSQSEQNLFLACSPPPKPPRLNLDEEAPGNPGWDGARHAPQKRKKCSSLPLLDTEEMEEEMDGMMEYQHRASNLRHSPSRGSLSSERDRDSSATCSEDVASQLKEEDSSLSFSLDLGPSILDDVLRVMENLHH